jgi:tryptophan-rich sensory protein
VAKLTITSAAAKAGEFIGFWLVWALISAYKKWKSIPRPDRNAPDLRRPRLTAVGLLNLRSWRCLVIVRDVRAPFLWQRGQTGGSWQTTTLLMCTALFTRCFFFRLAFFKHTSLVELAHAAGHAADHVNYLSLGGFERLATHGHHPPGGLYVCNKQSLRLPRSP